MRRRANVGVGIPHTRSSHWARAISATENWYICASSEDGNSGRQSRNGTTVPESVPPIYAMCAQVHNDTSLSHPAVTLVV